MSRRKLLIAAAISALLIIVLVAVAIIGGIWFVRSRNKRVPTPQPTAVGVPKGDAVTKTIGPDGGTISSSDGRITVSVPPQALSGAANFSIQPIMNMVDSGLGDAYRLEPHGQTFTTPIDVTFKLTDLEIGGNPPQAFAVVYQDDTGVWQQAQPASIEGQPNTFTVSTTHFSNWAVKGETKFKDWDRFKKLQIEPQTQTVRPGQSTYVELTGCDDRLIDKIDRLIDILGRVGCGGFSFNGRLASSGATVPLHWGVDIGTIETGKYKVKYTAPSDARFSLAIVRLPIESMDFDFNTELTARIYIEAAYKASGQNGPMVYSGTVCSLAKPFTIKVTHPLISYEINFIPSEKDTTFKPSPVIPSSQLPPYVTGTFSYAVTRGLLHMSGSGRYVLRGEDTDHPVIACFEKSEAHGPLAGSSGQGEAHIQLNLLQTNDCGGN